MTDDPIEQRPSRPVAGLNMRARAHADRFSFAVLPDRSGNVRKGVFHRISEQVELLSPHFAVFIGDAIEICDADAEDAEAHVVEEWDEFQAELSPITRPVYFVPGWHDYKSPIHARVFQERFGPGYYSWDYHGCHFIVLNCYEAFLHGETDRDAVWKLGAQQLDWLALNLSMSRSAAHTFVFVHAFYESVERREIADLLRDRPCTVISGSTHCYRKQEFAGLVYYQLGTAGGYSTLDGIGNGTVDHFTWVTVDNGQVKLANVLIDGVLPDDFCTEETAAEFVAGEVIISGRMSIWED
ncbi:MAG: hypothetical protein P4L33_08590 [Capsulimonadaceae bacterium]|nr:hypothetical protein [Capsulimonadaceae bacterium]